MPGVKEARLLATKESKSNGHQLYLVDYAVKKPGEDEERMLLSAVCLGFNGRCAPLCIMSTASHSTLGNLSSQKLNGNESQEIHKTKSVSVSLAGSFVWLIS